MRPLCLLCCLFLSGAALAQSSIAQFVIWQPKPGAEASFIKGYQQHLQWHKTNGDTWSWYGWFIQNGPRDGQFVDATFDRAWSDFDRRINAEGDAADNSIHTHPFADVKTVFKVSQLKQLSVADSHSLQSKYLRLITLEVTDLQSGIQLLEQFKRSYSATRPLQNFLVYKLVDGGPLNQLLILWGFNSFESYGTSEDVQDQLYKAAASLKEKTILSFTAEMLVYRADMSLFPN